MSHRPAALFVLLLVLTVPRSAPAQPHFRITGGAEYARITADDSFLGDGAGWSAGLEWLLTSHTALEVEVSRERHVRTGEFGIGLTLPDGSFVPYFLSSRNEGTATFLMASLTHSFGNARIRPVVWGGLGLMRHPGTLHRITGQGPLPPGTVLPDDLITQRGPAVNAAATEGGFGLDVAVGGRLVVRPFAALRLVNTENVGPKYIVRTGGKVLFRW